MRAVTIPLCSLALLVASACASAGGWPVTRHDARAELDPARSWLRVVDALTMAPPPSPDAPLHLLLHRELELETVEMHGTPLRVETREGWRPRDFWERPDYAGLEGFEIVRQHTVWPPLGGWPAQPRLTLGYAGAVYDSLRAPEVAYARGFETTSGLIDERGAYLAGSTFWLPWTSEERFSFALETLLPGGWESMSQGRRAEHGLDARGRSRTLWVEDHPMESAYLIAGPYVIREAEHDGVALYTYTYEDTPEDLCQTYLDATGGYLDLYGGLYGPYPFAKFAMVENWWQTGFGMPGFTLLGDRVIRLPFIVHTSYGHEILHNWWGNGVFVDYAGGNWCEGLTAYGADYLYKERESEAAARDYRRSQLIAYLDYASSGERDFPLTEFKEREDFKTQALGYGKTLMLYHMLRRRLGDEGFQAGLRRLYAEQRFRPARWDDVRAAFEHATGEALEDWFAQWLERPGALRLALGELRREAEGLRVEILQQGAIYDARVPVVYEDEIGRHERIVEMRGERASLLLPSGASSVAVDPDYHLFRRLYREEIPPTLSQVLGADSTLVIVGDACDPELAEALREVGASWAPNQELLVCDESALREGEGQGRALYLLGPGSQATRALEAAGVFGEPPVALARRAEDEDLSLIFCVRDPADPELAWTVVLPASVEVAAALGRKIPHYGRYSYLLFEGEQNVEKGTWTVQSSPLLVELEGKR